MKWMSLRDAEEWMRTLPGVGEAKAQAYVKTFADEGVNGIMDDLAQGGARLQSTRGWSAELAAVATSYYQKSSMREFFAICMSLPKLREASKTWLQDVSQGGQANVVHKAVVQDPFGYLWLGHDHGVEATFSFEDADRIYLHPRLCGGSDNDPMRSYYLVYRHLQDATNDSRHSYFLEDQLAWQMRRLPLDTRVCIADALDYARSQAKHSVFLYDDQKRFVLTTTDRDERKIVEIVSVLHHHGHETTVSMNDAPWGRQLDDVQRQTVRRMSSRGVFVLLGYAGTGKTELIRGLVQLLGSSGVFLAAPTGMTVKNLKTRLNVPGLKVTTLAKIKWCPKTAFSVAKTKTLIIDEMSMVGTAALAAVLNLVNVEHLERLVLVGDLNQLPPIKHGAPLRDLAASLPPSCQATLTRVYRQGHQKMATEALIDLAVHGRPLPSIPGTMDVMTEDVVQLRLQSSPAPTLTTLRRIRDLWREGSFTACITNKHETRFILMSLLQCETHTHVPRELEEGDAVRIQVANDTCYRGRIAKKIPLRHAKPETDPYFQYEYRIHFFYAANNDRYKHQTFQRFHLRPLEYVLHDSVAITKNRGMTYVNGDQGQWLGSFRPSWKPQDLGQRDSKSDSETDETVDTGTAPPEWLTKALLQDLRKQEWHRVRVGSRIVLVPDQDLELGYCFTTHKYQGMQTPRMLTVYMDRFGGREMMYVGASRFSEAMTLVGPQAVLHGMASQRDPLRRTRLEEQLLTALQ